MRVTILGASRFGVATVKQLVDGGHEVVLIDKDRARLDELADSLDCGMIHGDGTLPSVLRDAYGDGSDALVALTNEDDVNILAAVVARSVGFGRVVPQIVRPELLSVVEELDLDDRIAPHESVARAIVSALTEHSEVETDLALHRALRIVTHRVPDALAGQRVGELDLPGKARAVALVRGEDERIVDAETELAEGDRLMLVTRSEEAERLNRMFGDG